MKFHVKLYATLRRYFPNVSLGEAVVMELPDGAKVIDLLKILHIPIEEAKVIFINHTHAEFSDIIKNEDLVVIFPPIGGG